MRQTFLAWAGLIGLLFAVMGHADAAPADPTGKTRIDPAKLSTFLDQAFSAALARHQASGGVVAVVQHGKIIALRGYGLEHVAGRQPVDPARTLFTLGSTTKVFTWITLMRAVEAGRVRLDRPVDDYLPPDLHTADHRFKPITVADLMRHTTGYEDNDYTAAYPRDMERARSIDEYLRTSRPDRQREPGTAPSYSNYAANLGARIALNGTGAPDVQTLFERDILAPLGMTSTSLREPFRPQPGAPAPIAPALAARHIDNVFWTGERFEVRPYPHMDDAPAGGLSSTGADMARLMEAMLAGGVLDGRRIYGPVTAQAFRTPLWSGGQSNRWMHGLISFDLPGGHQGIGHDGGVPYSVSVMMLVPDLDLGVFAASNGRDAGQMVWDLPAKVMRAFVAPADVAGPAHPRPPDKALVGQAALYAGDYLTVRRAYHGLAKLLLYSPTSVSVDAAGYLHAPSGGRDRKWVPAGPAGVFVDAESEEKIAFKFDSQGHAVSWVDPLATRTYERIGWLQGIQPLMLSLAGALLATVVLLVAAAIRAIRKRSVPGLKLYDAGATLAGALVLGTLVCMLVTMRASADPGAFAGGFPPPALRAASVLAFAAAAISLALVLATPLVWRSQASRAGKAMRIVAALLLLTFFVCFGSLGGLSFWN